MEEIKKAENWLRGKVGRYAFDVDSLGHRFHLPEKIMHNLCLAADVTVGWGPNASDWDSQKTPFLKGFYRWFWEGRCPDCGGSGEIKWMEVRQEDGTYQRSENVPCFCCEGSGIDPRKAEAL
jgi:hypothetical protein